MSGERSTPGLPHGLRVLDEFISRDTLLGALWDLATIEAWRDDSNRWLGEPGEPVELGAVKNVIAAVQASLERAGLACLTNGEIEEVRRGFRVVSLCEVREARGLAAYRDQQGCLVELDAAPQDRLDNDTTQAPTLPPRAQVELNRERSGRIVEALRDLEREGFVESFEAERQRCRLEFYKLRDVAAREASEPGAKGGAAW